MAARLVQGQVARLNICADSELASNVPLVGRNDDPSRVMSKADLIEAFRWDAGVIKNEMAEAKDLVQSGVCGHSLRRAGCKALARQGVTVGFIQLTRRHSSQAVLGYIEEAAEECDFQQHRLDHHLEVRDQIATLVARINDLSRALQDMRSHLEALSARWEVPLDREAILKLFDQWARPAVIC